MESARVAGDAPAEDSEMRDLDAHPEARSSHGTASQESNKGDSSPDEHIVKIWSVKAGYWRYVSANYIDNQVRKRLPA